MGCDYVGEDGPSELTFNITVESEYGTKIRELSVTVPDGGQVYVDANFDPRKISKR